MERKNLSNKECIEFLKLAARMASSVEFERRFGFNKADIDYYLNLLDIKSPQEARDKFKRLSTTLEQNNNIAIIEETKKIREAEAVAQQRLDEFNAKKNAIKPIKKINKDKIKKDEAKKQKRWLKQQEEAENIVPEQAWNLPVEGTASQRLEQIERFRREITYQGMGFVRKKYGVTNTQIKFEANKLNLGINWDIVRK